MKFVPKRLDSTADNSSGKENWRDKLKNLVSVVGALAVLYIAIGFVADFVAMSISEETEAKVFGPAVSMLQSASVPPEFNLAEKTFDRLIRGSDLRPLPYRLAYWGDSQPNAFAVPGGGVIVTRGLLNTVTNETALAFVLGHELGHHQHRHTLRGIGRSLLVSLVYRGIFGASGGDVVSGTLEMAELGHSRRAEHEADEFGFRLAYARFGNADGYLEFFEQLHDAHEHPETQWMKFINSHPPTTERLNALKRLQGRLAKGDP